MCMWLVGLRRRGRQGGDGDDYGKVESKVREGETGTRTSARRNHQPHSLSHSILSYQLCLPTSDNAPLNSQTLGTYRLLDIGWGIKASYRRHVYATEAGRAVAVMEG